MADVFSKEKRKEFMSNLKEEGTKIELVVRKWLYSLGYRYRLNDKRLPGTPDIIIPKYKTAIFINGCFWHAHKNCKYFTMPKTRVDFWRKKLSQNTDRDEKKIEEIQKLGWKAIVIWECEIKDNKSDRLISLLNEIRNISIE